MPLTGADSNGVQFATLITRPGTVDAAYNGGKVRVSTDRFTMVTGAMAKSKNLALCYLPDGAIPLCGIIFNDTSLGSSVAGVGIIGTLAKYMVAVTKTSITPLLFGITAAIGVRLSAAEEVVIANDATADFPTTGVIGLTMFYSSN